MELGVGKCVGISSCVGIDGVWHLIHYLPTPFRHLWIPSSFIILSDSSPSETMSSSESFLIHGCELFLLTASTSSNPSASQRPPSLFLCQLNRLKLASLDTALALSSIWLVGISHHLPVVVGYLLHHEPLIVHRLSYQRQPHTELRHDLWALLIE